MNLTALDIKKHEFSKSFRGFDAQEVQAYLEMLAEEFLNLQKENDNFTRRILQLETQLSDYKSLEEKWKFTMMNAQNSADKALESSRKEADILKREAELKAEEIIAEARRKTAGYREELDMLQAEKNSFIKRLKHLLKSQWELIDVLEKEDEE
ncbi:DivIVA domain-containing protein [bacterium]|nr:DivIVA domain-containing protein [bacterium]